MSVAVGLIALLIAFCRMPDRLIYGYLWGEDGVQFLSTARAEGIRSLIEPYANYLHVIPRIIALVYVQIGADFQAGRPFAWLSAFGLCCVCAYVYSFARRTFPETVAWAFGLTPILVPHDGEVWLTITNLQWVIAPAFLIILWDEFCSDRAVESSLIGDVIRTTVIVILTLTGPFGLLYMPLVVASIFATRHVKRSRKSFVAIGCYLIAVCCQAATVALTPSLPTGTREPRIPLSHYVHFPWKGQFLRYLTLDFVMPLSITPKFGSHWGIAAAIVTGVMVGCFVLAGRRARIVCFIWAALATFIWAISVVRTGTWAFDLKWNLVGARYFYVPFVFMAWALILSAATTRVRVVRFSACFLLVLALINSVEFFHSLVWPRAEVIKNPDGDGWLLTIPPHKAWYIAVPPKA